LTAPEACRRLIALAVSDLDARYYPLVRQLADGLGWGADFARACVHLKAMLDGAILAAPTTASSELERSRFVLKVIKETLGQRGLPLNTQGTPFAAPQPNTRRTHAGLGRPRIRPLEDRAADPTGAG
jgi:hypothetical protein